MPKIPLTSRNAIGRGALHTSFRFRRSDPPLALESARSSRTRAGSKSHSTELAALSGPKGIADDIRKTLEKAMAGVLADPKVQAFMKERGLSPSPLYGDELRDAAQKEIALWREVVRKNNIKVE